MPSITRVSHAVALVLLATVASAGARDRDYPVNVCVAGKQIAAGDYCARVLGAAGGFEESGNGGRRTAVVDRAGAALARLWSRVEGESAAKGSDCADATLDAAHARLLVDSAAAAIVDAVNAGLNLGNRDEARCGRRLLAAAAAKCKQLLRAEGRYIRNLAADPQAAKLAAERAAAAAQFDRSVAKALGGACPTTITGTGLEAKVDALRDAVVKDTTVSPNVDAAQFTTILPTGSTKYLGQTLTPVCMNGTPYAYFVKRGTVNKLLVYYQGGGACWEQLTCSVPVCDNSVNPAGGDNPNNAHSGFADITNPMNPFKDWNVVFVPYCSCDIHFGDAAQDYSNVDPSHPLHVEHRGYENARVVEKWAREHFLNPDVVFVTGSSAGAYGAWFHGPLLHSTWPASRFHVLADAGNGVVTQDFLDKFFPNWNFSANLPADIPELKQVLDQGLGIPGYTEVVAHRFPRTTWSHYATAFDGGSGGQTGFYNLMLHDNDPLAALTWWNGSCAFHAQMRTQALMTAAALPSNYRYYIGSGSRHTMWGSNKVYDSTAGGVPTLVSWINGMLNSDPPSGDDPAWSNVECTDCGRLLSGDPRPSPLKPPFVQQGADVVVQCSASGAFVD